LCAATPAHAADQVSEALYRLPFSNEATVKVFDDFHTHHPAGRTDLFAVGAAIPVKVVAAADGVVMAIQDNFSEQQSGRAAKDCRNNYVWLAHKNGEWTNYSHVAHGSARGAAHLRLGMHVKAGQLLGFEGAVGCAMLHHVHFEVARPASPALDDGGFLLDNDGGKRELEPRFCSISGWFVSKDQTYTAMPCVTHGIKAKATE
jgi:murein DD-endopeptidase MepM/ murein hydrolase activator NlpD